MKRTNWCSKVWQIQVQIKSRAWGGRALIHRKSQEMASSKIRLWSLSKTKNHNHPHQLSPNRRPQLTRIPIKDRHRLRSLKMLLTKLRRKKKYRISVLRPQLVSGNQATSPLITHAIKVAQAGVKRWKHHRSTEAFQSIELIVKARIIAICFSSSLHPTSQTVKLH